jgi:hypothetical protein
MALVLGLASLWLGAGLVSQTLRHKEDNIGLVAHQLAQAAGPDDVVATRDYTYAWAVMWELKGDRWGDPLHAYWLSPRWDWFLRVLPAPLAARFAPSGTVVPLGRSRLMVVDPTRPWPDPPGDLIIFRPTWRAFQAPDRVLVQRRLEPPLFVEWWRRAGKAACGPAQATACASGAASR